MFHECLKLSRRRVIPVPGGELYLASPEDIILSKLQWGMPGQSEKQWRDVLGVLKVQMDALDMDYLSTWAEQLGLSAALAKVMIEAGL